MMKKRCTLLFALAMLFCAVVFPAACAPSKPPATSGGAENAEQDDSTSPEEEGEYSKILQNVLDSSYYNGLIDQYKNNIDMIVIPYSNSFEALPMGFFEKEGLNIAALKADEVEGESVLYIREDDANSLYIATNIETKTASLSYYSNYLLKYTLTDKELADFKMLFEGDYVQANFFVQELSYVKSPTVVSETKIEVDSYKNLLAELNKKSDLTTPLSNKIIGFANYTNIEPVSFNQAYCYMDFELITASNKKTNISAAQIASATLSAQANSGWSIENDIYKMGRTDRFVLRNMENYKNSIVSVTSYTLYDDWSKAKLV